MNLIFITRKVDYKDSRASFVLSWLKELAKHLGKLSVICLEKGESENLPGNVEVLSMGKERGKNRLRELWNLEKYLWRNASDAEGIFVHMHPIYVIAAWPIKFLFRKKLVFWYTHKSVDLKLKIAEQLCDVILTASKESFRLPSEKVRVVGHGIDLEMFAFRPKEMAEPYQIVSVGRISEVKDYETLIKAAKICIIDRNMDLTVNIYGDPAAKSDEIYLQSLRSLVDEAGLSNKVIFHQGVPYHAIPDIYHNASVAVNMSATGSIDKSVLEAAACGVPVLSSNEAFMNPLSVISPDLVFARNNYQQLAEKLQKILTSPAGNLPQRLREWVEREHDLKKLSEKITNVFVS